MLKDNNISTLPKGWQLATLGELSIKLQYGWTTSSKENGVVKLVRTTDISNDSINWDKVPYCENIPDDVSKFRLEQNDILISRVGSVGLNIFLQEQISIPAVFASYLIRMRIPISTLARYVSYFLKSDDYWRQISNITTGIAQPNINASSLAEIEIPVPPIDVQERILGRLDSFFKECQSLKNRTVKIKELEDKSFLKFLFDGQIQYPQMKLESFCSERNDRIGEEWKGIKLIGVSKEEGVTELRVGVKTNFKNYKIVHPNDFVYNPMRVDVGSISIWEGTEIALTSPDYIVFSVSSKLSSLFLLKYLKSSYGLAEIKANSQGSVRSRLYFKNLTQIRVPYCGKKGQTEAQVVLLNFKKLISRSKAIEDKMEETKKRVLAQAFEGSLISENTSSKHSAVDLVEQISALREKAISLTKTKPEAMKKPIKRTLSLKEFIATSYGGKRFTFDDIEGQVKNNYEDFKEQLYSLLDTDLVMEFDSKSETMYFKMK